MKKKLIRIVSLVLIAVMAFSLCSCTNSDDDKVIRAEAKIPQTKQEIFDYFCNAVELVKTEKPKVDYSVKEKAKSPESDNSHIKEAFPTIAKLMTKGSSAGVEYGQDNSEIMPQDIFDIEDIRSANIIDIDDTTSRSYTIIMTIWEEDNPTQDESVFGKMYKIAPKSEILEEMKKGSAFFTVEDYDSQYNVGTIRAVISKETNQISELSLERSVIVSTSITGQGTLADVGTASLSFRYESTESYGFDWNDPATKDKDESLDVYKFDSKETTKAKDTVE